MSVIAQYDARMTLNTTPENKKKLQELAAHKRITDAEILRLAVNRFLEIELSGYDNLIERYDGRPEDV